MSFSQIDPELEEKLNDIDEFIQSQRLGVLLPETDTSELTFFLGTRNFLYGSPLRNNPGQDKLGVKFACGLGLK